MTSEQWQEVSLGEVTEILTGFPFKSKHYVETDGIRLIRGDNVVQGTIRWENAKLWSKVGVEKYEDYLLRERDIVLAMDRPWIAAGLKYASIRKFDTPSLLVQRVTRLRGNQRSDTRYLSYIIGSDSFTDYVLSIQTGTSVPHISGNQIRNYQFRLPKIKTQRAIAKILGDLDDKIDLLREMNLTLEKVTRTLFRAWFADFSPVHYKAVGGTNFRGMPQNIFEILPDSFESSEIGDIPEGWTVQTLSELVSQPIKRGLAPKYISDSGVAVLNQKCVRNWEINFELARRHDEKAKPLKDKTVELLDILVNSTGVGTLGRVSQVYKLQETTTVDSHISLVRANPEKISPILLGINLTEREAEIERLGHGSTGQTELSRDKLGDLPVIVPPTSMQRVFDEMIMPLVERKTSNSNEIETLAALRNTLIPKLISGELEAPSLEALGLGGCE